MLQCEPHKKARIGVVNFLNTTPLIDGLDSMKDIKLVRRVPSELIDCIEQNEVDIALASTIDYQRSELELRILPVGVLSSDGETLTVRLCSRRPLDEVTEVHCDTDSHTSIALLQIILNHRLGAMPKLVSTDMRSLGNVGSHWPDTMLIIGDKVVSHSIESSYRHQLDLGQAWKKQTGLPFVFATWFGRADLDPQIVQRCSMILDRQRRHNTSRMEQVVSAHAVDRGWETDLAFQYVTSHIQYSWTEQHGKSLELFFELAVACGALNTVHPIRYFSE